MNPPARSASRSITESPWYWAYLFCTGGLIALVIVGPKYAERQLQIEQNGQKRQWAAQLTAGRTQADAPDSRIATSVTLWPLFVVLGSLLCFAWIKLIRDHRRRPGSVAGSTRASEPGDITRERSADDGSQETQVSQETQAPVPRGAR